MISFGIDPAVNTGIAVLEGQRECEVYVYNSKIAAKKYDFHLKRWHPYMKELEGLLKHYNPDIVVFEGYGFASHSLAVSVAIGTLLRHTVVMNSTARIIEVAPMTLKKFITGKGNAKKDLMMLEVFKRWNFAATSNDAADAYALAKVGMALLGHDVGLPKANMASLDKVRESNKSQLQVK